MNLKQFAAALGVASVLLTFSTTTQSEIYRTVDENGNVTFSDNPDVEGGEKVDLEPINTQPKQRNPFPIPVTQEEEVFEYEEIAITNPANDHTVPTGFAGTFSVAVQVTPSLLYSHRLQLMLDGAPYGKAGKITQFQLQNIPRGAHQLVANVIDKDGNVVDKSKSITVNVIRAIAR